MANWYVDPAATGANNGTSWADAWVSLQSALDSVSTAVDNVYCRGTQTLTAQLDADTNDGTVTADINFIGVNGSGSEDGTQFVIDANSTASSCLVFNGSNYLAFRNMEFKNATSHGVTYTGSTSQDITFYRCSFNNNGGSGMQGISIYRPSCVRCEFNNNTGSGAEYHAQPGLYLGCRASGNGVDGFRMQAGAYIYCIADGNTSQGFDVTTQACLIGCIADDNQDGFAVSNYGSLVGIKSTNNSRYGIDVSTIKFKLEYSHITGNTTANIDTAGYTQELAGENLVGSGTIGYTNQAAGNYNPTSSASLRDIILSFLDGTNNSYITAGIFASSAASGGGLLYHPGMQGNING